MRNLQHVAHSYSSGRTADIRHLGSRPRSWAKVAVVEPPQHPSGVGEVVGAVFCRPSLAAAAAVLCRSSLAAAAGRQVWGSWRALSWQVEAAQNAESTALTPTSKSYMERLIKGEKLPGRCALLPDCIVRRSSILVARAKTCKMCRVWKQRRVMPLKYWRPLAWAAAVALEEFSLLALHCRVSGAGAVEAGELESRRRHPSVAALQCLPWRAHLLARLPQGHSPP